MLRKASQEGDLEKVKQIFAYVNQENINQERTPRLVDTNSGEWAHTPLTSAAYYGHHQVCEYLIIQQKANLEAVGAFQWTALIWAASSNRIKVIKLLLQNNANVKAKHKSGHHAAYEAARYGYVNALRMLVEKDGDVIYLSGPDGETPLIAASKCGRVDVCKYIVEEKNANVNLKDRQGRTALQYATDPKIIKILEKRSMNSMTTVMVNQ